MIDITGKPEDAVATALYDAGWDEHRAIDLLLEGGDHLTAWEETGKKGKKKAKQSADDKDDAEDMDAFNGDGFRDAKGGKKGGPPRMRRGGGNGPQGERSGRDGSSRGRDFVNGGGEFMSGGGRGRGDQPPRRGKTIGSSNVYLCLARDGKCHRITAKSLEGTKCY